MRLLSIKKTLLLSGLSLRWGWECENTYAADQTNSFAAAAFTLQLTTPEQKQERPRWSNCPAPQTDDPTVNRDEERNKADVNHPKNEKKKKSIMTGKYPTWPKWVIFWGQSTNNNNAHTHYRFVTGWHFYLNALCDSYCMWRPLEQQLIVFSSTVHTEQHTQPECSGLW